METTLTGCLRLPEAHREPQRAPQVPLAGRVIVLAATMTLLAAPGAASAQQRGEIARPAPETPMAAPSDGSPALTRRVQRALAGKGYRIDSIDGVWGAQTTTALRSFQRDRGLAQTGQADAPTMASLGLTSNGSRLAADQRPGGAAVPATYPAIRTRTPAADLDPVTIRAVQQALRKHGFQTGAVDGTWGEQTASAIGNFQRARGMAASGNLDAMTLTALGLLPDSNNRIERRRDGLPPRPADLDPATIRMIQQALNDRGFGAGAADGNWGERTTTSLREFQRTRGIEPSGEPDVYSLVELELLPNNRSRSERRTSR